jgi:hypothetical protein
MASRVNRRSFDRKRKTLDRVEVKTLDGIQEVLIPALPHSIYWAALRYLYEHPDEPVPDTELCNGVARFLAETDPIKWQRYSTRPPSPSWRSRMILNVRNLCRLSGKAAYGKRFLESGHVLRCAAFNGSLIFTLHTRVTPANLAALRRGRKLRGNWPTVLASP